MVASCKNRNNPKFRRVRAYLLERPWASDREVGLQVGPLGNVAYYTKGVRKTLGITREYQAGDSTPGRKRWITVINRDLFDKARKKSHKPLIRDWEPITRPIGVEVFWEEDRAPKIVVPQVKQEPTLKGLLKEIISLMEKEEIASLAINQDGSVVQTRKRIVTDEFSL